ncbi:hypothetical protein ALC57_18276 [Trachymyrmex cornetzi]|uniref:Uncharacterized protein n=1 Tax=Trachymyrmex cornetzi TaxID=471704 RepID=A0A151ISK6_9HYME|nr:hypothetical protein ALC57_18276 [Trachymyrmex cornetzi]
MVFDRLNIDFTGVEACIGLSYKALGRFLLGFGSSSSPEKIVSGMIGSLEDSAMFSTICFSGSTIANAVERLTKSCDKRASLRTESRSHSRLGSYEGQNEDWYGLENKEEEQEDSSNSETRRRPTRSTAAWRSRRVEKKNVDETLKIPRGVTIDVQLQQLANRMRIP